MVFLLSNFMSNTPLSWQVNINLKQVKCHVPWKAWEEQYIYQNHISTLFPVCRRSAPVFLNNQCKKNLRNACDINFIYLSLLIFLKITLHISRQKIPRFSKEIANRSSVKEVEMEKDVDVLGKYRNVTNKLKK